jgi:hypothetical protein
MSGKLPTMLHSFCKSQCYVERLALLHIFLCESSHLPTSSQASRRCTDLRTLSRKIGTPAPTSELIRSLISASTLPSHSLRPLKNPKTTNSPSPTPSPPTLSSAPPYPDSRLPSHHTPPATHTSRTLFHQQALSPFPTTPPTLYGACRHSPNPCAHIRVCGRKSDCYRRCAGEEECQFR